MHKRDITYEDFDGNSLTETFYFNLNKAEALEIQAKYGTGTRARELESAIDTQNFQTIFAEMTEIVLSSFGEKSADGKSFSKSPDRRAWFKGTNAYAELITTLAESEGEADKFMKETLPAGFVEAAVQDKPTELPVKLVPEHPAVETPATTEAPPTDTQE